MEYLLDRERFGSNGGGRPKPILYEEDNNGCWNVISHKYNTDGYIKIQICNKTLLLHRLVYQQENNYELSSSEIIRHKCDNPHCINPQHLEVGTSQDNVMDRVMRKRSAVNEKHGRAKLTNQEVIEIFYATGTQTEIAKQYNVSQKLVSLIKKKAIHQDLLINF